MSNEHPLAVVETVDDNGSSVAKSDLEDGLLVFVPPFLKHVC
jgi:hypothetical protein